jgi:hypothetical protein
LFWLFGQPFFLVNRLFTRLLSQGFVFYQAKKEKNAWERTKLGGKWPTAGWLIGFA